MFWGVEGKASYPKETHKNTGRACASHYGLLSNYNIALLSNALDLVNCAALPSYNF